MMDSRQWIRRQTFKTGIIESALKDADKDERKFTRCIMTIRNRSPKLSPPGSGLNRGQRDVLKVSIKADTESTLQYLYKKWIKIRLPFAPQK